MRPSPDEPGSRVAVAELAMMVLLRETERVRRFLGGLADEPEEWVQAGTLSRSDFWATAEETAELSRTVQSLTDRFAARDNDPAIRPEGARRGHLLAIVNAEPR